MKSYEVFGIKNEVVVASYVDRGGLDKSLSDLLVRRQQHVAIRGASKCGKSWLRRHNVPDPIDVQCLLGRTVTDLYIDALARLDVQFEVVSSSGREFRGRLSATSAVGVVLLGKIGIDVSGEFAKSTDKETKPAGRDINDLRYIAELLKASGRKLVIEDFHYLSVDQRRRLAFDLKAFWDYGLLVIIVGVWSQENMLLALNPDLSGRIEELSVTWSSADLGRVLDKGGDALNLEFRDRFRTAIIDFSFENVGILQMLALRSLDILKISETLKGSSKFIVSDYSTVESAAMDYAEQITPLYQQFARDVSEGMRRKKNTTGIYAHAMAAIMSAEDKDLIAGLDAADIYKQAHARQKRVQLGNLKSILGKIEELQVDDEGRGLVISYNPATEKVTVVDRQILMYRRFATVPWPWEALIYETEQNEEAFSGADAPVS